MSSVQKISFMSNPHAVESTVKPAKPEDVKQENNIEKPEKENHTIRNWSIALGALATLIGLGVLVKKGNLSGVAHSGEQNLKGAGGLVDDVTDAGSRVFDEQPISRGVFGQDIYNPGDPLNYQDVMSPYYNPMYNSNGFGI